jgi:hypothetical protein
MSRIVLVMSIYHCHKPTDIMASAYLGRPGDNWVTGSSEMGFPPPCRHRRAGCPVFAEVAASVVGGTTEMAQPGR